MKLKKILAVLLVMCLLPVCAFAEEPADTYSVQIGSSSYALSLPYGFYVIELNKEDIELGAVNMFVSNETPVQLYIYEDVLDDYNGSMAEYLASEGETYAVEVIPTEPSFTVGDVDVYLYENVIDSKAGKTIQYENYAFEEDGIIYELDFAFEQGDEDQLKQIQEMADTIVMIERTPIAGTAYGLYAPGFECEVIPQESDEIYVEHYVNEYCELSFDVIKIDNADISAEDTANALAGSEEDVVLMPTNDADIYLFFPVEEIDGEDYLGISAVFEEDGNIVVVEFWFQNENSGYQAAQIISTLKKL